MALLTSCLVSSPAAAQSRPLTGGTGPHRPAEVPVDLTLSDGERGRIAARQYGNCAFQNRRRDVLAYFAMPQDSALQETTLHRLASDRCMRSGKLQFAHWYYRGILFRSAYFRQFRELPATLSPQPMDYSVFVADPQSGKSTYYLTTMAFGQCVVRKDPRTVLNFLLTRPGSPAENRAIEMIKPNLASCIPAGSKMKVGISMVEATLSEALYREAQAAAGAGAAGQLASAAREAAE